MTGSKIDGRTLAQKLDHLFRMVHRGDEENTDSPRPRKRSRSVAAQQSP